jgi:hypothetical protein
MIVELGRHICTGCAVNTYQSSVAHYFTSCTTQETCKSGQYYSGDNRQARARCTTCPANTWMKTALVSSCACHRTTLAGCIAQTLCGRGQYISGDSKSSARTCGSCGAGYYQTSTSHRSTTCL